ncbi:MAG: radical SAM protein [SAR202 cluster bacterium]|mgnify:CR=1 FL=1|jgi:organic radical activating enzyme|nr:radical SAM protein [SAR202 cluster bacterium]
MRINKDQINISRLKRLQFDFKRGKGHFLGYIKNRVIWHVYPRLHRTSKYPDHVDIEISSKCNMKCPMCYTNIKEFKKSVKKQFMSFEIFKKILDELTENQIYSIRLSFRGEPFIHKDIIKMIRYAKEKGIKEVSTLSNILALKPDLFKEAMHAGLDWLTISFDGTGETYEKIRKPAKFDESYRKIKEYKRIKDKAKSIKPIIKVQSIWPAIKDNAETYYKLFEPYVDDIAVNPLYDYLHKDSEIIYEKNFDCPSIYQRLVISSAGKALLCINDERGLYPIGDISKETIYEIWHGQKLTEVRRIHRNHEGLIRIKPCKDCYFPRQTYKTVEYVGEKKIHINKLVNRTEEIGK